MLRSKNLFPILTAFGAVVLATPSDLNPTSAIHEKHDSRETRSLASLILKNSSTGTTNLTIPTLNFPDYNISSNEEPTVFCHINYPPPAPQIWGNIDLVECGLLIMILLATDFADLHASQWSPTSPLALPWTWGVSQKCTIKIDAVNPGSLDVFQRVMIAQRAALIVNRCLENKGGIVSLGPRELFQVQVFGFRNQATA